MRNTTASRGRGWKSVRSFGAAMLVSAAGLAAARADVSPDARMLRFPAVSESQIAFVYANNLWVVARSGGVAKPVAAPPGATGLPHFSPDGKTLAFVGNYDGNRDIYTIPVDGGIPQRVTHHPGAENLAGWAGADSLLAHQENQGNLEQTIRRIRDSMAPRSDARGFAA